MKLIKGLKSSKKPTTTATVKKPVPVIAAPVPPQLTPEPARKIVPATTASARKDGRVVTIEAKVDVGFGNMLFVRGEGSGLSWDRGVPLVCVDGSTWKWSTEAAEAMKFKLLLNDAVWSKGEDLTAAPGQRVEVAPSF